MLLKQKIAVVANTSWSIYNFRLGFLKQLKARGFDIIVIAPKDNFSSKLIAEGFIFCPIFLDSYGTNFLNELRTLYHLTKIYKKYQVDFIFHYTIKPNIYGSMAAAWCRIPSIAVTTGLGHLFSFKNHLAQLVSLRLYRFALQFSKEVWFLNQADLYTFVEKKIVPYKKTFLLPSEGVNTTWFAPKKHIEQKEEKIILLYAGRIIWEKGIQEIADAALEIKKEYPNVEFQLLGFLDLPNPNVVPVETIEAWHKQKIIRYVGETTDVRPFIRRADCLIFPSYYREGVSRILLEAASMAKPLITTDNIGCREVVEDGVNGFLCQPKNSADLVAKIRQFIELPKIEKNKMGENSRKKILAEYDEQRIINIYLQKIQEYLGKI